MKPNRVEVSIFGSDYTIIGEASEAYILSIALFVDKKMQELSKAFPNVSKEKLAVLAAINITDEFFQYKEQNLFTQNEIEEIYQEKTKKLISMIDQSLIG